MIGRYWLVIAAIVPLAVLRIASTHLTFAQTLDEPVHVGAGHEWLTRGTYLLDFEHPPLPRALFALPFIHDHSDHPTDNTEYGNDLFALDDRYIHNVAAARRGNLLFFVIAALALAASTRKLFGDAVACVALFLFANLPAVLAHAGLATTDMAGVAGFAVALFALLLWTDDPSWPRTILLGVAIAFGISCKYSFPFFFPPVMLIVMIARRRFAPTRLLVAFVIACVVTWGAFGFEIGTIAGSGPKASEMARLAHVPERWTHVPLPARDLFLGFIALRVHNQAGHAAYLFGRVSHDGWWYYFPIALAIKTPIPYLLFTALGVWLLVKRRRDAAFLVLIAAVILAIAMCSRINIGVRHILAVYIPLSMIAGYGVVELWRTTRIAVGVAMLWLIVSSVRAHPDYIPWMNAFAGERPYRALLDSNFDWGQDIWRLARVCKQRGITWLGYDVVTSIRPSSIGITGGEPLREDTPTHGWVVISEQKLELARIANPHAYGWLESQPHFERIGKTLRLYHVK